MSSRVRVQRAHPVVDVLMNGGDSDAEVFRDLLVRSAPPEGSDNLALAAGEAVGRTYGMTPPLSLPSSSATGTLEKWRAIRAGVHHDNMKSRVCFGSRYQLGFSFPSVRAM
jgi:hypothetical protein